MSAEFVVFDADGEEMDWYDPYEGHRIEDDGTVLVDNGYHEYRVEIPLGGRYVIRPLADARPEGDDR